jgi:hypothetical protein
MADRPQQCRARAERLRRIAAEVKNAATQRTLLEIAAEYDEMAQREERRPQLVKSG